LVITIFAPAGIGEVGAGTDVTELVANGVAAAPEGPLRDGDIVVVTSKIISKAEGRVRLAAERQQAIDAETARTVAARDQTRIVRTHTGLTTAAAGVDSSNVAGESILLLPRDPDRSARTLRAGLVARCRVRLGVIISDTAGRAWRMGQTDHAIGAAGVRVVQDYAGTRDAYGNLLSVTAMAVGDELAAAADLAKGKLSQRPVAVIRGLENLVVTDDADAASLVRPQASDLFGYGSREAVLIAALEATGQAERYEELVGLEPADLIRTVLDDSELAGPAAELLRRMLEIAYGVRLSTSEHSATAGAGIRPEEEPPWPTPS
jgi:coenzyme F420-0:L-glutamate ligase / coenzyme F420-1:gamma-L-glutamate ligase